jgi:hypothetical protein
MNGMEKTVVELHGMLKIADGSIKKNPNHMMMMMVQKKKKKWKRWTSPKSKGKKKDLMSPRALSLRQMASLSLLLMKNVSTATRRDIGSGTVKSTSRSRKRRRREVRLLLQVLML